MAKFKSFLERELKKYGLWELHKIQKKDMRLDGSKITFSQLYTIYKDYNQWAYSVNSPGTWAAFMTKLIPYIDYQLVDKILNGVFDWAKKVSKDQNCNLDEELIKETIKKIEQSEHSHSPKLWGIGLVYSLAEDNKPTQITLSQSYGMTEVTIRNVVRHLEEL